MRIRGFEAVVNAPVDTKLPVRGSEHSAGYDAFAPENIFVPANGFSKLVPLNIKAYMLDDEWLAATIRSSLAIKEANGYLQVSQGTAVIDSDYYSNPKNDGNIGIVLQNRSDHDVTIKKGERCCQLIFMKFLAADNDETLGTRTGGYGSTGV